MAIVCLLPTMSICLVQITDVIGGSVLSPVDFEGDNISWGVRCALTHE